MCDISVLDPALGSDLFLCVAVDSAIYFGPVEKEVKKFKTVSCDI